MVNQEGIPIKTTMDSSTTAVYGGLVIITMSSPIVLGRADLFIYCNSLDDIHFLFPMSQKFKPEQSFEEEKK